VNDARDGTASQVRGPERVPAATGALAGGLVELPLVHVLGRPLVDLTGDRL